MTASNEQRRLIERADDAFGSPPPQDERETGFEADELDDMTIQTRRACRALLLADALRGNQYGEFLGHKRFYSATIELAFQAIERTCQAALIDQGFYDENQTHSDHARTIGDSWRAGLWDQDEAQRMAELYRRQRAKSYYDDGVPSRLRAEAMVDLAQEVHRLAIKGRLGEAQCLCDWRG